MGDWKPAEGPSRMATPPTGLRRSEGSSPSRVAATGPACPRCGAENAPHLRFCNNCGFQLQPDATPPQAAAISGAPGGQGAVCWRCYGVGDPGADFCKFCGARYADAPGAQHIAPAVAPGGAAGPQPAVAVAVDRAQPGPAPVPAWEPPPPAPVTHAAPRATLVSILKDGTDGQRFSIHDDHTDIGRDEGQIVLGDDPYLSPRHARLSYRDGKPFLLDLDSVNGIYARIREPVELADGDMILLGQQVLRFELLAEAELPLGPAMQHGVLVFGTPEVQRVARLVQYTTEGVGRDIHYLYRDETVIGREQGDLVFTDDPFMSRRHASISIDRASRRFVLRDLGSSNGTAIRFRGERGLRTGDQFRVGRHLFRFETGATG